MKAYQFKIVIEGSQPPVWRRVLIPEKINFHQLHYLIQIIFGWEDEHLHDFYFSEYKIRITNEKDSLYGGREQELSENVYIDELMKEGLKFLYTYDYGDDWRHKISVEKIIMDYENRFPMVIKYKGNNFCEDSGGVFGGWEDDTSFTMDYSMDLVNQTLQKRCNFGMPKEQKQPSKQSNIKVKKALKQSRFDKELYETVKNIKSMMSFNQKLQKEKDRKPSRMDLKYEKLEEFYQKSNNFQEPVKQEQKNLLEVEQEGCEQLSFDFLKYEMKEQRVPIVQKDNRKQMTYNEIIGYQLVIEDSDKSYADLLSDLDNIQLRDYCKYLHQTYSDNWSKYKYIEKIKETIMQNPQYLLLIYEKVELLEWMEFVDKKGSIIKQWPDFERLYKLCCWGLLDVQFENRQGYDTCIISVPKDIVTIRGILRERNLQEEYKEIYKKADILKLLIQSYGMIELSILYQMFQELYKTSLLEEDFYRYIYLYGRYNNRIVTFTSFQSGISYASAPQLDVEKTLELQNKYAKVLPYAIMKQSMLKKWDKGIGNVYPQWQEIECWLKLNFNISNEVLETAFPVMYAQVCSGMTTEKLIESLLELVPVESLGDKFELWILAESICQNTMLAVLKGHTRITAGELLNQNPMEVIGYHEVEKVNIKRNTPSYLMPLEFRKILYRLVQEKNIKQALTDLLALIKEYNYHQESRLYLATLYGRNKEYDKARQCLYGLMDEVGEDYSILYILDSLQIDRKQQPIKLMKQTPNITLDNLAEYEMPYRREEKKISPNEKCPCGSGKKYKFCCSKN